MPSSSNSTRPPSPLSDSDRHRAGRYDGIALLVALVLPTLVTLVYFQWLRHSESIWQQLGFGIGKLIQFSFPVLYTWFHHRKRIGWPGRMGWPGHAATDDPSFAKPRHQHHLVLGILFALASSAIMFAVYFLLIEPTEIGKQLQGMIAEKLRSLSIVTVPRYFGVMVFYAIGHSFLEEYYWRWFVFDMTRRFTRKWPAILISGFGFSAHHVVVLGFYFGWGSVWTYLLSLSVAVGGFFWAWLYDRDRRLVSCWVSHAIIDAAIFSLGFFLAREMLGL